MNPTCPIHEREMSVRRGKFGLFYSCGAKDAGGNWCRYKTDKVPPDGADEPATPPVRPVEVPQLPSVGQTNKDKIITRTAVAKSLIESGMRANAITFAEADAWIDWIHQN